MEGTLGHIQRQGVLALRGGRPPEDVLDRERRTLASSLTDHRPASAGASSGGGAGRPIAARPTPRPAHCPAFSVCLHPSALVDFWYTAHSLLLT